MSIVLYEEGATPWMQDMARDILELLSTVYPGHPWSVRVYGDNTGGGYFIRHLEFEGKPYGQNQPRAHLFGSASELRADVIRRGGEVLERVNLRRARRDDDPVGRMEGVPEHHQPAFTRPPVQFDTVINVADHGLRDEPRPQALREANDKVA